MTRHDAWHDELVERIFDANDPRQAIAALRGVATDAELLAAADEVAAADELLAAEYKGKDDELVEACREHAARCHEAAALLLERHRRSAPHGRPRPPRGASPRTARARPTAPRPQGTAATKL